MITVHFVRFVHSTIPEFVVDALTTNINIASNLVRRNISTCEYIRISIVLCIVWYDMPAYVMHLRINCYVERDKRFAFRLCEHEYRTNT